MSVVGAVLSGGGMLVFALASFARGDWSAGCVGLTGTGWAAACVLLRGCP